MFLLLQYDRTAKNLGELLICPSYYMPGENTHSFRNVHFYAISEQLLGVRHCVPKQGVDAKQETK